MNNLHRVAVFEQLIVPLGLLAVGIGIWIGLSPIPDDELTTAQTNMLITADWIVKTSVGAILGLGSNAVIRARNGNGATKQPGERP